MVEKEKHIDRKTFLKLALGIGAAGAVGGTSVGTGIMADVGNWVTDHTGRQNSSGAASPEWTMTCSNPKDDATCTWGYKYSTFEKVMGVGVSPVLEELECRTVPSAVFDYMKQEEEASADYDYDHPFRKPLKQAITGHRGWGMTRGELLLGAGTTVVFAGLHNIQSSNGITPDGVDTTSLPTEQAMFGVVAWYLQRKFGAATNILAHMGHNFKAIMG